MPWFHAIAERNHEFQNPTSAAKLRQLGEDLRLNDSHVLDVASGKGGPATLLAREFGCRLMCVEAYDGFIADARDRAQDAGVADRIEIVHAKATDFAIEAGAYDAALCLGATFAYGGLAETLAALVPAARVGGHVAIGEVFWQTPPPDGIDTHGARSFAETFAAVDAVAPVISVIASSADDWDRYESLHYASIEDWLAEHDGDPDADAIRTQHQYWKHYNARTRGLIGWAIFSGRRVRD
jgi:ubiquinone/menaquinone biosynthesis C-methylase UbiE